MVSTVCPESSARRICIARNWSFRGWRKCWQVYSGCQNKYSVHGRCYVVSPSRNPASLKSLRTTPTKVCLSLSLSFSFSWAQPASFQIVRIISILYLLRRIQSLPGQWLLEVGQRIFALNRIFGKPLNNPPPPPPPPLSAVCFDHDHRL